MKTATPVFKVSFSLAAAFLVWGAVAPTQLATVTAAIQRWLLDAFGWFYLLCAVGLLVMAVTLIFSRYGDIPLGKDGEKPEFPLVTWFAMLFCAGMGIGLVFWGVAEPTAHFYDPPRGVARHRSRSLALQYSFFPLGLHPWGNYTHGGNVLAYFNSKANRLVQFASCEPIFG